MKYRHILEREGITEIGVLPISVCHVLHPHLLARAEKKSGARLQSVICFLVPYYTGMGENLSAYAVSEDYHLYMKGVFERICPLLKNVYLTHEFVGFADHSPIDERDAVLRTGLAMKGDNRLLIHREYGSFFFVGEILTTLSPESLGYRGEAPIAECLHCGACKRACKTGLLAGKSDECLSAVTQKKGILSRAEIKLIRDAGSAWGCDACQTVCPYNKGKLTPIPFFYGARLARVSRETVLAMSEEEFARRAFAWRGKETLLRNLDILESDGTE